MAAVLLISSSLTGFALRQRQAALDQQTTAVAQARLAAAWGLAAQAAALRSTDIRTALRLGIAAERIRSTAEMRRSLYETMAGTPLAATMTGQSTPVAAAFGGDGRTLVTASRRGTAEVWDLDSTHQPSAASPDLARRPQRTHPGAALDPGGAPPGHIRDDHVARLWDLTRVPPDPTGRPRQDRLRHRRDIQPERSHSRYCQR